MQRQRTGSDRSSIRFQLFRLVVMVTTAVLIISMVGGALFEWSNQQKQVERSLATIAQAAGVAASAAVAFQDRSAGTQALRILAAQKAIEAAALYPLEGYRLASYGNEAWLPNNVDQLSEQLPSFSLFSSSTTLFQPIWLDGSTIGYIFIRSSLKEYHHTFLLQAALAIGVNLLGLLLVLALGLRFLDRIVKPVKELADTSRQVREDKNFSRRASPPVASTTPDEIGELIVSFNAMLAEIEQREQALASYQNSLEQMVLERTEALQAANTELQAAKEAAEAATVSKSRFLAAASHDLRQPIQAINLFQNVLNGMGLNAEQKRISDYLALSAQSLGDLLNALLDISKLDAGAIRATPQIMDVHDLLCRIDAEFAPLAAAKSLRFKLYFPPGEMAVFTDGKLLQNLLRNLIGNALKYTERGGVLVAIRRRGDQAMIQVLDTGIGIAPEHIDSIFDEYFQVANPERDKAKGLGLGLSIVKRQAKLLATEIVCRSRLGRGTVFEFRLPLADNPREKGPGPIDHGAAGVAVAPGLAGCRIAVIDDEFMIAKAIEMSLESLGMRVATYRSAEEALADCEIANADFYIVDVGLPGANGIEFLDTIQKLATNRIGAVLLSGETSPDRIETTRSSHWPVLFKPVDLTTLLSAIESQNARH
ncbi:MAG: hybrid sensor histidine kinase/response regulator [Rhodocyclaceae bacterium]|nr:hybrid sensor histidine kinase/response regulator [Rhodocyclaceae bacterium]